MLVSDGYVPQRAEHCVVARTHSSFGDSFGSCRSRIMEQFTITIRCGLVVVNFGGHYRHVCVNSGHTAQCEPLYLRRLEIILLTYLLTILIS